MTNPSIAVLVLAHNEERRIRRCLRSLPLGRADVAIHVVVNGSTDRTAEEARSVAAGVCNVRVHVFDRGGKARSWNRFLFDVLPAFAETHVFVDGDAELMPDAIDALTGALLADSRANAAAGFPGNGRARAAYEAEMLRDHGLFGDLYALSGNFLARMKAARLRLPDDLIGEDALIGALAKTDLATERDWDDRRVVPCPSARFLCETVSLASPRSWRMQYRRMVAYSVRHYQNRIVKELMGSEAGPRALPRRLADIYPARLDGFRPRRGLGSWLFDRQALGRMARAAASPIAS